MRRAILDTSVYGQISKEPDRLELIDRISSKLVTYGFKIVRDEIRDVPKKIRINNKSLRLDLLNMYDSIVKDRTIQLDSGVISLADNYFMAYRQFGGIKTKEEIINDFLVVSAASKNGLEIVATNDEKTMLNPNSLKSYTLVNPIRKFKNPSFINYKSFLKLLRGEFNEFI